MLRIPRALRSKTPPLTSEELAVYGRHPLHSADLLAPVELPWDITAMIRGHRERLDGSGYPQGLRGDQIPLEARIIGMVDYHDSVASTATPQGLPSSARFPSPPASLRQWWGSEVCEAFYGSVVT
jgi:HD-GYP domain-containing protein (c-di-GMP phosphodiesterase class II)